MLKQLCLGAVVVAMSAAAAAAGHGAPPPDATTVAGIDVVAPAPLKSPPSRAAVDDFVGSIGTMSLSGQLATWSRTALPSGPSTPMGQAADSMAGQTICTQIMGLPKNYADFIAARIRQVGKALGAPVSDHDCRAEANNVVIVFPTDAAEFVQKLADEKPQAFGFPSHGALVEDLARPPAPIRAWYGVQVVTTEKRASRLALPTQSVIYQVLIVVDRDKTNGMSMGQLSDYLTMISLAQVKPEKVPPTAPSILNLFADTSAGRSPAQAMTRMDAAYLQALYAVGIRQPGSIQNGQIASRIRSRLTGR